jgi:mannose-1-phosphate guanylyltransferase
MQVDAVVLVGGLGTRLRPLTLSAPKPMLPTAGVPFLAHLLSRIGASGIEHVLLATSYQAAIFADYFGDGASFGLEIEYLHEGAPLGTGGGIRNAFELLRSDTTLVFNGDSLSGVDLGALLDYHAESAADVTVSLATVADPSAFGCVVTGCDGRVTAFLEKSPNPPSNRINAGLYVFRRQVLESIPAGRPVSIEREIFPQLIASGMRVFGYADDGYWRDIGEPSDLVAASADLVRGIAPSAALPGPTGNALILSGASVDHDAKIGGGTTVGAGAVVESGAIVDGCVIFDGARIAAGAIVRRSIVGFGARIGRGAHVEDAVLGDRSSLGAEVELLAGARVWPDVVLADRSVRFSSDV